MDTVAPVVFLDGLNGFAKNGNRLRVFFLSHEGHPHQCIGLAHDESIDGSSGGTSLLKDFETEARGAIKLSAFEENLRKAITAQLL